MDPGGFRMLRRLRLLRIFHFYFCCRFLSIGFISVSRFSTPPRSTGLEPHLMSIHTIVKKTRKDVYAHDTKPDTNRPAHANKFNLALNSAWVLINALK